MAFIPIPACVQTRLIWLEDNGNVAQNVFYHGTAGVPTLTDLEEIGTAWGELYGEGIQNFTTQNWALSRIVMRAMNEEEGLQFEHTGGLPAEGLNTNAPSPDQVAYTVTWSTGQVGRSARGRTYGLPPAANFIINRNRLADAGRAQIQSGWDTVLDAFQTEGHALQVVSFSEGGVPRTEGRKLVVLAANVRFPLATQRRRLS